MTDGGDKYIKKLGRWAEEEKKNAEMENRSRDRDGAKRNTDRHDEENEATRYENGKHLQIK